MDHMPRKLGNRSCNLNKETKKLTYMENNLLAHVRIHVLGHIHVHIHVHVRIRVSLRLGKSDQIWHMRVAERIRAHLNQWVVIPSPPGFQIF